MAHDTGDCSPVIHPTKVSLGAAQHGYVLVSVLYVPMRMRRERRGAGKKGSGDTA